MRATTWNLTALVSLAWAFGGLTAGAARADYVMNFESVDTFQYGQDITVGWSFTTNESIAVTALGLWARTIPNGSTSVRLYDGAGTVLASADVSTSDPLGGASAQFFTHAINPVTLAGGATYYIAADIPGFHASNHGMIPYAPTGLTLDPSVSYAGRVSSIGAGGTPTSDITGGPFVGFLAPNFVATAAVPEPSTAASLLVGGALLGLTSLRRRAASRRRPAA